MKFLWLKNKITHFESFFFNKIFVLTTEIKKSVMPNFRKIIITKLGGNINKFSRFDYEARISLRKKLNIKDNAIVVIYSGVINRSRQIEFLIQGFNNINTENTYFNLMGNDTENGNYLNE
jgi:hypothetical protein